jgi:uncharacterized protein (TIGR00299 family) protein
MNTIYLNNFSGVSGVILLAALLQKVPASKRLENIISDSLGYDVKLTLVDCYINGVAAKRLKISLLDNKPLEYRNINDIKAIIDKSSVDINTKKDAKGVLEILAEAESIVHNIPVEKVHFHEIGAVDTIIDILGVCYLINLLKPINIISAPIKLGSGFIKTSHGILPNPPPATLHILQKTPIENLGVEKELTTPTGAALIKYFVKDFSKYYSGVFNKYYYSTGSNVFEEIPNLFCLIDFKTEENAKKDKNIIEIEANIDDMPALIFSYVQKKLLQAGALDTFFTPVFTKKNRPTYKLNVLCTADTLTLMCDIIFSNTTTAGVRYVEKNRYILEREINTVNYMNQEIRVKSLFYNGKVKKMPEWEDVESAALKLCIPPYELYTKILEIL